MTMSPVVEYRHLISLWLGFVINYSVDQFLNEKETILPPLTELKIKYSQLKSVIENFTRNETRRNCVTVKRLIIIMNRKFRCGRLLLTKGGITKKLELANGGGSRFCPWDHEDMDFKTVHHRLLTIFEINNSKCKTSLYDFQHRPLDINEYENVSQYIDKYGLNTNSTIVYLCTSESSADNDQPKIIMTKTEDTVLTKVSTSEEKQSTLTITSSTTTSVIHQKTSKQQELHRLSIKFGYRRTINNLLKKMYLLINEQKSNEIFIQLLQNISSIKHYIFSTICKLQKKLRRSKRKNESIKLMKKKEILLYTNDINYTYDTCQSTKELILLNKKKFDHIQMFSIINSIFSGFFSQLQDLRRQWIENVEGIPSSSHVQSSSQDHHGINTQVSTQRAQTSTASSSQTFSSSDFSKPTSSLKAELAMKT